MELETAIEDIVKQLQELGEDLVKHWTVQQWHFEQKQKQEKSLHTATFFIKNIVLPHVQQLSNEKCSTYLSLLVEMQLMADAIWLISQDTLIRLVIQTISNVIHIALIVDVIIAAAVDI